MFELTSIRSGSFPLWNPYMLSGVPFLADLNAAALYPFQILYAFFEPFTALRIFILIHILSAAYGMYVLARSIGISRWTSCIPAIIFGFSGSVSTYTNNTSILAAVSYVPWVLYGWIRLSRVVTSKAIAYLVLLTSLQIISGHPQFTYYTCIFGSVSFLYFSRRTIVRKVLLIATVFGIVCLLSAIQLLPFFELVTVSTRIKSWDYAVSGSFSPFWIIRLIAPSITGNAANGTAWVQLGSVFGYMGILPLFICLQIYRRSQQALFWLISGIVFFLISLGNYSPIYYVLYHIVPGFGLFRVPSQLLTMSIFCIAVYTGICIDDAKYQKSGFHLSVLQKIFLVSIMTYAVTILVSTFWNKEIFAAIMKLGGKFAEKISFITQDGIYVLILDIVRNCILILIIIGTYIHVITSLHRKTIMPFVCILLISVDLFIYSRRGLQTVPNIDIYTFQTKENLIRSYLDTIDWKNSRLYVDPSIYPAPRPKIFGVANDVQETEWQFAIYRPNIPLQLQIPIVDGYNSLVLSSYQRFFNKRVHDPTGVGIPSVSDGKLGEIGVKYILSDVRNETLRQSPYSLATTSGNIGLFRNGSSVGSVYSLFDGTTHSDGIMIQKITPNKQEYRVSFPQNRQLVITNVNYPGWTVKIDGVPASITPYRGVFMSTSVPMGEHTVSLQFFPKSLQYGVYFSILGCVVVCVLLIAPSWMIKKRI